MSALLANGGTFRCGLYSQRGRQFVFDARRAVALRNIGSSHENIVDFRHRVLKGEVLDDVSQLVEFADFFSTSACRDLIFHVHEDSYTPQRLKTEISEVGMEFIGFNDIEDRGAIDLYRKQFPNEPTLTNLENWDQLERTQNSLLEGYDFWCWKPL